MLKQVLTLAALSMLYAPFVLADEQQMEASDDGQIEFSMPSGNIGCIYTPEGGTATYEPADGGPELSCDRIAPHYSNVLLGPDGEAVRTDDPGEQGCCGAANIFEYGNSVMLDGFACYSETTGLSCETEDGAHGFSMSRATIKTY